MGINAQRFNRLRKKAPKSARKAAILSIKNSIMPSHGKENQHDRKNDNTEKLTVQEKCSRLKGHSHVHARKRF